MKNEKEYKKKRENKKAGICHVRIYHIKFHKNAYLRARKGDGARKSKTG